MATPVLGLGKRLRRYRKFRGWNQWDMARILGVSQSNMSRLEADKQDLSGSLLRKIVELDEEWFGDLAGAAPKLPFGTVMVPVVGEVSAGTWRPVSETQDPPQDAIPVFGLEGRFRNPQAMLVKGSSMNKVFRPGTILITVSPSEFVKAGYTIQSDIFVIAQQTDASGRYETTVKQLEILPDGAHWLWPRSHDPQHQQPIKVPPAREWITTSEDGNQVNVGEIHIASVVVMEQQLVVPTNAG